jgi:hypothetical protein
MRYKALERTARWSRPSAERGGKESVAVQDEATAELGGAAAGLKSEMSELREILQQILQSQMQPVERQRRKFHPATVDVSQNEVSIISL